MKNHQEVWKCGKEKYLSFYYENLFLSMVSFDIIPP